MNAEQTKKNELIIEYANLALKSAKQKVSIDESEHKNRAHEIRVKLDMSHKTICCLATNLVV